MKNGLLNGLTEQQISRVKSCKNQKELMELAKQEGIELTDEQLAAVSGGGCFSTFKCPKCGCKEIKQTRVFKDHGERLWEGVDEYDIKYRCKNCGHEWWSN